MISLPVRSTIRRKTIVTNCEVPCRENPQAVRVSKMANAPTPHEGEVRVTDRVGISDAEHRGREASSRGQITRDPVI